MGTDKRRAFKNGLCQVAETRFPLRFRTAEIVILKYLIRGFVVLASLTLLWLVVLIVQQPLIGVGLLSFVTAPFRNPCVRNSIPDYVHHRCTVKKVRSPITPENANTTLRVGPGYCPLIYVLHFSQSPDVFEELLDKGAEPKLCAGYPDEFYRAFAGYCGRYDPKVFKTFRVLFEKANIELPDPQKFLFQSAKSRCDVGVEWAVDIGASVNIPDPKGRLPLDYAVMDAAEDNIRLAKALVQAGADPYLARPDRDSPYEYAEKRLKGGNWPRLKAALLGRSD